MLKMIWAVAAMIAIASSSIAAEAESSELVAAMPEQTATTGASSDVVKLFRTIDKDKVEVVSIDDDLDAPSELKEVIKDVYGRAKKDLPEAIGQPVIRIDLVAIPHPDIGLPDNPRFSFVLDEAPVSAFIPLVGRAAERKTTVYVALGVDVTFISGEKRSIRGLGESSESYSRGFGLLSGRWAAKEKATKDAMDLAYRNLLSEIRSAAKTWVGS